MKKFFLVLVTVVLLIIFLYQFTQKVQHSSDTEYTPTPQVTITETPTPIPTPETITYEGKIPAGYTHFIEAQPKIDGQQGYVAFPKTIEKDNPPALVIYYHGSGQQITTNFSDEVMKNMRKYGAYFTERNIAFLASNQHGDNQGNSVAITDSEKLIAWVHEKYLAGTKLYVLGFSMGGKPAMRHVLMSPKAVSRIALLAPAQQIETYTAAQVRYFREAKLKVWHGTADVNVPYWVTEELQSYFKKYDVPLVVVTLKGKTHWDVDTEYMKDIYEWFMIAQ